MSNIATSSAGKRISALLDDASFVEIGAAITARATDFNLNSTETPSDGVITGYGLVDGNLVYVYSQDASVLGGSIGEMHAKKIANLYDLALKVGAPVIGLIDSAGIRLQESTDALNAFGMIYQKQAMASGIIPQITAVFGSCGGGLSLFPALTDFTFMEEKSGKLFVNSPNAIAGNSESKLDTAAAAFQAENTELVDGVGSEEDILDQIRMLISLLPANNEEVADGDCEDDLNRVIPEIVNAAGDTSIALSQIADEGSFLELKASYAKEMVTGLMKLDGMTVGAIANRTVVYDEEGKKEAEFDGNLTVKGARKAEAFVKFCDAFEIPVLTLTNVSGFAACECAEKNLAKAAGKLTYAFAEANVPKVNVYIGKAFGSAYAAMNSKALGCDMAFAWPNAQIGTMAADLAAKIMYDGQSSEVISQKAKEYEALQLSAASAARRGYVDAIIEPAETRKYVIGAFEMLYTKSEDRPYKKHGAV